MTVVYAVQQGPGGPVKIGHARSLERRLNALQTGSPVPLVVLAVWPGGCELERELHQEHATHRMSGEWFAPEVAPALLLRGGAVEVEVRAPGMRGRRRVREVKPKRSPEEVLALCREAGKRGGRPRNAVGHEATLRRQAVLIAVAQHGSATNLAAELSVSADTLRSYTCGRRSVPDDFVARLASVGKPPLSEEGSS